MRMYDLISDVFKEREHLLCTENRSEETIFLYQIRDKKKTGD